MPTKELVYDKFPAEKKSCSARLRRWTRFWTQKFNTIEGDKAIPLQQSYLESGRFQYEKMLDYLKERNNRKAERTSKKAMNYFARVIQINNDAPEAIKTNTGNPEAHLALGKLYLAQKDFRDAACHFRKSMENGKGNESKEAYFGLGKSVRGLGNYGEATSYFESSLEAKYFENPLYSHDCSEKQISIALSNAYLELGIRQDEKKNSTKAGEYYNKAVNANSDNADAFYSRAMHHYSRYRILKEIHIQKPDKVSLKSAYEDLKTAINLGMDDPNPISIFAELCIETGSYNEAIENFKKILDDKPFEKIAKESIAFCYHKLGDEKNAKEWMEKAGLMRIVSPRFFPGSIID